uniref:NADH-ubiquinone oxidoreductase chain 1 n=1 Tax=Schlettererius cinctipes TaxID=32424 RepID=C4NCG7_9HYME|nr:NADH dehydrogenase subunit 1 [Schlettererius cinctipes]
MQMWMYIKCMFLSLMMVLIGVLLSVAYLTLLERKLLSYMQNRKGPNKVGIIGFFQPFSDAIKLFSKENFELEKVNMYLYFISPIFLMLLMLMMWILIPMIINLMMFDMGIIIMICFMSMTVYGLMMCGWSSNSIYSILGSIRSIAQTVSYEVSMIIMMLVIVLMVGSFDFYELLKYQKNLSFMFFFFMLMLMFMVMMLIELNRSPFDLSEGESELVSGFNTEYMSGMFALIFLSEYGMILFMGMLMMMMFWGGLIYYSMMFIIFYFFMVIFVIWSRASFPRIRYDQLMFFSWFNMLPSTLNLFMFYLGMKIFFIIFNL